MAESRITKAYSLVENYNGTNNQILYYKHMKEKGKLYLEPFGVDYILENFDFEPFYVNKTVKITEEFGRFLQEKYIIEFTPKVLYITRVIGKVGNSYHCYAQYRQSIPPRLMYISSKNLLTDIKSASVENKEVDFSIVDNLLQEKGMALKPHQRTAVQFLVNNKRCILADGMGLGKMQPNDTKIPTPNGYKQLGDIKIGDKVFGSSGVCNVIGVYPQGVLDSYEVTFSDGTKTECGLEHLWIVCDTEAHIDNKWEVKTLKDIISGGVSHIDDNKPIYRYKIPHCFAIEMKDRLHTISPKKFGELCEYQNTEYLKGNIISEGVLKEDENYYIPQEYLFDSINNRLGFIEGVFGSLFLAGIELFTKFEGFAISLCDVISSLGGSFCFHKENNGEYILSNMKLGILRGQGLTRTDTYDDYLDSKYIISVEKKRTCENTCIKVDNFDESYLCEGFIVTHNTIDSIAASITADCKKTLIITTASLKSNWERELLLFEDSENISVINGSQWEDTKKFTILNYDIIQNFYTVATEPMYETYEIKDDKGNVVDTMRVPVMVKDKSTGKEVPKMIKSRNKQKIKECLENSPLFQTKYDCVIIDEAQKLSNNTSIRYKTISDFLQKTNPEYIFLISGTPLTNRPINLYHVLKLINADVTKDYKYFVERFCGGREIRLKTGKKIMTMNGATHLDELKEKIKNIYIRRLSSEIDNMVNKKITKKIYKLNITQEREYANLWNAYVEAQTSVGKESNEEYRKLVEGIVVRQYLANEMVDNTTRLVDRYIEKGKKAVIITTFQEEMDKIAEHYGDTCVCYNGKMTAKQKDKAEKLFKEDDSVKVLIGNVIACGVGLNLQNAKLLVFNSYDWVAANNKQAEDRIYRLTSTEDVTCIYQLFDDSISRDMFEKVLYKEQIMDNVIKSEQNK